MSGDDENEERDENGDYSDVEGELGQRKMMRSGAKVRR